MRGIRARGSSIVLSFSFKGVQCRETIPLPPNKANLAYVKRKRETILFQIVNNTFEYGAHFPNSKTKTAVIFSSEFSYRITIKEALESWLRSISRKVQLSTEKDYTSAVYYHLIPSFGHYRLNDLTVQIIEDWINEIDISNKRINNVLVPLRAIFKKAHDQEYLKRNPLSLIKNLPIKTREPNPLTPLEVDKVLNELSGQVKNYIQLAIWSGLRTSELLALKWSDYNCENSTLHVSRAKVLGVEKKTKTISGNRIITLLSGAKEALNLQKSHTFKDSEYIFHDPRSNLPWKNDQAIRKIFWYPALTRANISKRSVYQTRHTFASMALSAGENFMWVCQQMGHDKPSTTLKSYGRYIKILDTKAGSRLESKLKSIVKS